LSFEIQHVVNRCLSGQQSAMIELVQQFHGQVFGLCYRMLRQRQDAEDATQETFFRALKSLERWDSKREFEPWLLAIAGNRCRTSLAKRLRKPPPKPLEPAFSDIAEERQTDGLLREEVDRALSSTRVEYRQAFLMFHEQELSYVEIATKMNVPLGTIKTWVHRARREIIRKLCERDVIQDRRYQNEMSKI